MHRYCVSTERDVHSQTLPPQSLLLQGTKSITEIKWGEYVALSIPMQHRADRGVWFIVGLSALHHFNKWPRGPGNILPAAEVLIRMRTFKLSVSATPFTLPTSFGLFFSLLALSLPSPSSPDHVCLGVCLKQDRFSRCFKGWLHQRASWPHSFISDTDLLLVTA